MQDQFIFWGESHDNTFQYAEGGTDMNEVLQRARSHLDFYAAAYYTGCAAAFMEGGHISETHSKHGLILEGNKPAARIEKEWARVEAATKKHNTPGEFITFPGYEWQGNGSSGDHNVSASREGLPVFMVATLTELYEKIKASGMQVHAIPHHTAYRHGVRGKDWGVHDDAITPFAEIFSIHGCSETDEEWIGLRKNSHMGPGVAGGTWQDALDRGYHVGAIGSTDNWGDMPGCYGNGLMAVVAPELTRKSLWQAMDARHVYGVTGDRIELYFHIGEVMMGDRTEVAGPVRGSVRVRGPDALDRVEILRNGKVIATHCHQGGWQQPEAGKRSHYKLRIEAGWGPRPQEMMLPDQAWHGKLTVDGGTMCGVQKCWISPGQPQPELDGDTATFGFVTKIRNVLNYNQNSNVFEFEATPESTLTLTLNGLTAEGTVADFCAGSRELWYKDDCVALLEKAAGIPAGSPERNDIYHHVAYKSKLHRAMPEAAYTATVTFEDDEPLQGETNYRVRVEQRNGQRAWSSPIWVSPKV